MKRTLYKYLALSTEEHVDRLVRLLSGWIYFASPTSFNDPFETASVLPAPTRSEFDRVLPLAVANSQFLSKSAVNRLFGAVTAQTIASRIPAVSPEWLNSIGVLSLTEHYDDILMWSHYASSHTGVCIGFDSDQAPFDTARAVEYTSDRLMSASFIPDLADEQLVQQTLFRKSPSWAYEGEWRAIKRPVRDDEKNYYLEAARIDPLQMDPISQVLASEGGPGLYQFEPTAIRRVYFGARIDAMHKSRLQHVIGAEKLRARVFQLSLDKRYFSLQAERVS